MAENRHLILSIIVVLIILIVLGAEGILVKLESRYRPFLNNVTLHCTDNNGNDLASTDIGLRRTILVNGQPNTQNFNEFVVLGNGQVSFIVTPSNEGNFSCVENNIHSTNSIPVVAYPTFDPEFTVPQSYQALVGTSSLGIRCPFQLGILMEYYEASWYRGMTQLDTASPKYEVLSNLSLVVHDADLRDSSESYYCELHVRNDEEGVVYSEYGTDSSLLVYGGVDLKPNSLTNTAVEEGGSAHFSCQVESAPAGSITWLVDGRNLPGNDPRYSTRSTQVNATFHSTTVASNLTITGVLPKDSALIQCVGHVDNGIETLVESNEATLNVLGDNFVPELEVKDNQLLLSIALPGIVLDMFIIHIRYTSTVDNQDIIMHTLNSATFHHTSSIQDFTVPQDALPTFSSFTAEVAIEVLGLMGHYSQPSQTITFVRPTTSSSTSSCSSSSPSVEPGPSSSSRSSSPLPTPSSGGMSSSVTAQPVSCSCNTTPLIVAIVILSLLLIVVIVGLLLVILCLKLSNSSRREVNVSYRSKEEQAEIQERRYDATNPCLSSLSHTSQSSQTRTSNGTVSPSLCSSSQHYSSISECSHSHATTPSRPSSQESYPADQNKAVSSLPHIYENDEILSKNTSNTKETTMTESSTGPMPEDIYKEKGLSSTAVGTSPPKGDRIILFSKGHSESPKRVGGDSSGEDTGVLSPARSDPSLESSLKSEHASKKVFSQSMAIPGAIRKDQETLTSPTLGGSHAPNEFTQSMHTQQTYQQFKYGTDAPPVRRKEQAKEDDKIYHKIINEYDVV